jgi:hypothetical protein
MTYKLNDFIPEWISIDTMLSQNGYTLILRSHEILRSYLLVDGSLLQIINKADGNIKRPKVQRKRKRNELIPRKLEAKKSQKLSGKREIKAHGKAPQLEALN